jgi:hypothetical protein
LVFEFCSCLKFSVLSFGHFFVHSIIVALASKARLVTSGGECPQMQMVFVVSGGLASAFCSP